MEVNDPRWPPGAGWNHRKDEEMLRKSLLCAALMIVGCGQLNQEDEFRAALPTREQVEMKAPEKSGQGLEAEVHAQAEQGQTSDLYKLSRGATVVVNGGTLAVLGLVDRVTQHRPTTLMEDTAVWGPHTEALSPNTWKLTVKKTGEHTYSYVIEAKAKEAPDTEFKSILTGTHTAAVDEADAPRRGFGSGDFTIDWNAAQTLPEHDDNVGRMTVRYAREDEASTVTVAAEFRQVRDGDKLVDADYLYAATPGQGGELDFKVLSDMYQPAGTAEPETLSIKSRWQESGAGRSDVKLSGGNLVGEASLNECWDPNFASRYLRASYAPQVGYGTEASDCVFTSAVYSSL